jgi:Lecithin retinol acyltransferase
VIEFGGQDGGKPAGVIRRTNLADFAQGAPIWVRRYGRCDEPEVVINRAESMLGSPGYDLFANNCEHFATWCITGSHDSAQVQAAASAIRAAAGCWATSRGSR